jgi:hypothetical protein
VRSASATIEEERNARGVESCEAPRSAECSARERRVPIPHAVSETLSFGCYTSLDVSFLLGSMNHEYSKRVQLTIHHATDQQPTCGGHLERSLLRARCGFVS